MLKKLFLFWVFLFLGVVSVQATHRECPTALSGYLHPIGNTPLSAAGEAMVSGGLMTQGRIGDAALFLGADLNFGVHQFYLEGGMKSWAKKYTEDFDQAFTNNVFPGMRELFYRYNADSYFISAGLQTSILNDFLILDERAFAVNSAGDYKNLAFSFSAGTVILNSARNGKFCSKTYIYDLYPEREIAYVGRNPGETNYAGFSVYWDFEREIVEDDDSGDTDEFEEFSEFESTDESEDFDEFQSEGEEFSEFESTENNDEFSGFESSVDEFAVEEPAKPKWFSKKKLGVVLFDEFGSVIDTNRFYGGIFLELGFPFGATFKHEVLYQEAEENRAFLILLHLDKTWFWGNRLRTTLSSDYYHLMEIDKGALPGLSFANLFGGTIMRLDVRDMPFYDIKLKHSFMKYRFSLMAEYYSQIDGENMQELDFKLTKRLGKNLKIGGVVGAYKSDYLDEINHLAHLEVRASFSFVRKGH